MQRANRFFPILAGIGFSVTAPIAAAQANAPLSAEHATPPPLPIGPAQSSAQPASDWAVWRAFHESLKHYGKGSSDQVRELLTLNIGIDAALTDRFLALGDEYLQELDRLQAQARSDIARRYPAEDGIPQEALRKLQRPAHRRVLNAPAPELIVQAPPGQFMQDRLAADGLDKTFEDRNRNALAGHQQRVMQLLGTSGFAATDRWIREHVAGSVKVFRYATPVPMPESFKMHVGSGR